MIITVTTIITVITIVTKTPQSLDDNLVPLPPSNRSPPTRLTLHPLPWITMFYSFFDLLDTHICLIQMYLILILTRMYLSLISRAQLVGEGRGQFVFASVPEGTFRFNTYLYLYFTQR